MGENRKINRIQTIKILLVILSLLCFLMVLIVVLLQKQGKILNIQAYIPVDLSIFFFAFGGLFAYIFLMFYKSNISRILLSLAAIMGIYGLFFITALGSSGYTVIKSDDYILVEKDSAAFFSGTHSFYLRENFLYSHYVDSCDWNTHRGCSYKIEANKLVITETFAGGKNVRTTDLS